MSWFDALLGRTRPVKSDLDALFGMSTAVITLQTEFDLEPTGGAGICFKKVTSGQFMQLQKETDDLMRASQRDAPLTWKGFTDPFGYQWIVLQSPDFANVVTTVHMISRQLQDGGYGEQLLASVFQFKPPAGGNVYWMYNYKRGTFYPFVPQGRDGRDNAAELRLSSVLNGELKIESDPSMWFAMYGMPLD